SGANAAGSGTAGVDLNNILAKAGDLGLDLSFGACSDPHHRDHRAYSDDDAERGKHRTHFVPAQRPERDVKCGTDSHFCNFGLRPRSYRAIKAVIGRRYSTVVNLCNHWLILVSPAPPRHSSVERQLHHLAPYRRASPRCGARIERY